ncbi:hypothetical protein ACF08N_10510 [Streptomyces sp. NPDC015127]|uniref:hypothetical protein n=1 Tax=Streptomyces sp. NPDC015127 TaxID=3364939 RepID=UPI0036FAE426
MDAHSDRGRSGWCHWHADPSATTQYVRSQEHQSGPPLALFTPVGLALCWSPKPDAPVRCCTLPPDHAGDHFHEYSGASWPQELK